MGMDPFVASTKVPPAGAKVPKARMSAAERLHRLDEAKVFLRKHLAVHPVPARMLIMDAKAAGIASRTLHRAKDVLGVQVQRQGWGQGGQWLWAVPTEQELAGSASLATVGGSCSHTP
jgi:hypothetical protein